VKETSGQLLLQAVTQLSTYYCQAILLKAMTGYQTHKFIFSGTDKSVLLIHSVSRRTAGLQKLSECKNRLL